MVRLREDVYPALRDSLFATRESLLDEYVEIARKVFSQYFSSKADVIAFLNNLRDPKDAEFMLNICRYYNISKNYEKSPFIKLVMMLSVIDKATRHASEYVPFEDWITSNQNKEEFQKEVETLKLNTWESFQRLMGDFKERYYKTYGSVRNIVDFLDKHLSLEDKIKITHSFHSERTKYAERIHYVFTGSFGTIDEYAKKYGVTLSENTLPECYDWRSCWIEYGRCHPEVKCRLNADQGLLGEKFKKIVAILYHFRSEFVHEARISSILPTEEDFTVGVYDDKIITIFIKTGDLEEIFEKALKKYFDTLPTNPPTDLSHSA